MVSEGVRPVIPDDWKADTLVTLNVKDVLREVEQYTADIVTDCRLFDGRPIEERSQKSLFKGVAQSVEETDTGKGFSR
jgi:hypothetical protein